MERVTTESFNSSQTAKLEAVQHQLGESVELSIKEYQQSSDNAQKFEDDGVQQIRSRITDKKPLLNQIANGIDGNQAMVDNINGLNQYLDATMDSMNPVTQNKKRREDLSSYVKNWHTFFIGDESHKGVLAKLEDIKNALKAGDTKAAQELVVEFEISLQDIHAISKESNRSMKINSETRSKLSENLETNKTQSSRVKENVDFSRGKLPPEMVSKIRKAVENWMTEYSNQNFTSAEDCDQRARLAIENLSKNVIGSIQAVKTILNDTSSLEEGLKWK